MEIGIWDIIVGIGIFIISIGIGVLNNNPAYTLISIGAGCIVYAFIRWFVENVS